MCVLHTVLHVSLSLLHLCGIGVLYLDADFQICEQGDVLTSDQAKLLKIFFKQMAEFKVCPVAYCKDGSVVDVADDKLSVD